MRLAAPARRPDSWSGGHSLRPGLGLTLLLGSLVALSLLPTASAHAASPETPRHQFDPPANIRFTYTFDADQAVVHAQVDVPFINEARDQNATEDAMPVPWGALNVRAQNTLGEPLPVDLYARDERTQQASVHFDGSILPGDGFGYSVLYEMRGELGPIAYVRHGYAVFPAVVYGDFPKLKVVLPADSRSKIRDQDGIDAGLSLQIVNDRAEFTWSGPDNPAGADGLRVFAVESMGGLPWPGSRTVRVAAGGQGTVVPVEIRYWAGEDDWAAYQAALIGRALPALAAEAGFPYDGSIIVTQHATPSPHGFVGRTLRVGQTAKIEIPPERNELETVRELANLWATGPRLGPRWLNVGLAEYLTDRVLASWGRPRPAAAVTLLSYEQAGYHTPLDELEKLPDDPLEALNRQDYSNLKARELFRLLLDYVSPEQFRRLHGELYQERGADPVTSQEYLTRLEENLPLNKSLDDLYRLWVFPASQASLLDLRWQTLVQRRTLRDRARGLGWELPDALDRQIATWRFADAQARLDQIAPLIERGYRLKTGIRPTDWHSLDDLFAWVGSVENPFRLTGLGDSLRNDRLGELARGLGDLERDQANAVDTGKQRLAWAVGILLALVALSGGLRWWLRQRGPRPETRGLSTG